MGGRSRLFALLMIMLLMCVMFIIPLPVTGCDFDKTPQHVLKAYTWSGKKVIDKKLDYTGIGAGCEVLNHLITYGDDGFYVQDGRTSLIRYSVVGDDLSERNTLSFDHNLYTNLLFVNEEVAINESGNEISGNSLLGDDFGSAFNIQFLQNDSVARFDIDFATLLPKNIDNETYYDLLDNSDYVTGAYASANYQYLVTGFQVSLTNNTRYSWLYRYDWGANESVSLSFVSSHSIEYPASQTIKLVSGGSTALLYPDYPRDNLYLVNFDNLSVLEITNPDSVKWENSDVFGNEIYFTAYEYENSSIKKMDLTDYSITDVGEFGMQGRFGVIDGYFILIVREFESFLSGLSFLVGPIVLIGVVLIPLYVVRKYR